MNPFQTLLPCSASEGHFPRHVASVPWFLVLQLWGSHGNSGQSGAEQALFFVVIASFGLLPQ